MRVADADLRVPVRGQQEVLKTQKKQALVVPKTKRKNLSGYSKSNRT